jgi:DNA-binding transcriptional LysR family regulator
MRAAHTLDRTVNLDLLRSFFEIAELGSLSKAAERLRVSQSTLTRQMHALEHEVGGALFERSPAGVALTATGYVLVDGMKPLLARFDAALADARKLARGQSASLRVGYIASVAQEYLSPALAALRRVHPEVKVKLLDLSPGEQIEALRKGEIDVALFGHAGASLAKEFYVRRVATLSMLAVVPENHPLAAKLAVALTDFKNELLVGAPQSDLPGYNRWITQLCRKAGFRARFVEDAGSLSHGLALVVTENAVSLLPEYSKKSGAPGVAFRPLKEPAPKWDLIIAWQRGRVSAPLRTLIDAVPMQNAR